MSQNPQMTNEQTIRSCAGLLVCGLMLALIILILSLSWHLLTH